MPTADPLEAYEAKEMDEICAAEEEKQEGEEDVKRSSIHQRYLEEKEDVMNKLKEQQAKTAAEAEAAATEAASQLVVEQKAAAAKKVEAEKLEQFLKAKVAKAKADEEATKAAKAAKDAVNKAAAEKVAAEQAAAKKVEAAAQAAEAKVTAEKKAKMAAEKKVKEKAASDKVASERASAAKVVAEKRAAKEAALLAEKETAKARKEEIKARMTPVKASPRRTPAKKKENLSPLKRDRADTPSSAAKSGKKAKTAGSVTPFKLTVPTSPKFAAGRKKVESAKTSEEIEIDSIQEKQSKLRAQREARKANMAKAKAGAAPTVAKSAKPLTEPKEFKRQAAHVKQASEASQDKLFGHFTSMAECVSAFETKTPTRFRSKKAGAGPSPQVLMDASKLTQPESPAFMSDKRLKGVSHHKTREEEEEEMMAGFEAKPFKATPMNIDATAGCVGVRQVEKVALTQAMSPKFRIDARGEARKHQLDDKPESPKPFKASKIAPEVLAGPKINKLKVKEVTVPVSPEFHASRRHRDIVIEAPEVKPFKAQPIPASVAGPIKAVTMEPKPLTELKPFNLRGDAKHIQAQAEFKAKIAKQAEEEAKARNFKANPINANVPNFVSVASIEAPTMTEPKPFNLQSEKLHTTKKAEWERQLEAELEEERAQFSSFRAKPASVLVNSPFLAKKSIKALTEITAFSLNSDKRSAARADFDADVATKQREMDLKKKMEEEEKERADKDEISLMRRTKMCFKATPITQTAAFTAQVSNKELTTPYSPQLVTKARASAR